MINIISNKTILTTSTFFFFLNGVELVDTSYPSLINLILAVKKKKNCRVVWRVKKRGKGREKKKQIYIYEKVLFEILTL